MPLDVEPGRSTRPRSSTNSFLSQWRRPRPTQDASPSPSPVAPTLPIDALIDALTPPAVPSLLHARSLASSLASTSPLPHYSRLNPVLASLCAVDSPLALQCAGYDIMSAYWENNEGVPLTTADRFAYFSLFLGGNTTWSVDLWEARLKALRALTKGGTDVVGIEVPFLNLIKSWIQGAFDGLDGSDPERERSISFMAGCLTSAVDNPEIVARIPENELAGVLDFYADLLDTTNHSTIAINLYLSHLSQQLKSLSDPKYLENILPVLFRALAFFANPLPRLTVIPVSASVPASTPETQISETLTSLFTGPYTNSCMTILKSHLFPLKSSIETAVGAHRALRNYIRRGLTTRLARAYISREASVGYSHSGAPGHMDVERDLMERAWPKEDFTMVAGWDAGKFARVLAKSVEAWVQYDTSAESVLEEVAGTMRDILQELDARDEEGATLDEEEASAVGETLYNLAGYIRPLKTSDNTPYIIPLATPHDAPTPFLRSLATLLGRDHTANMSPSLSAILLYIAPNLTDIDTSKLPLVMSDQHDLSPTSPDWLKYWDQWLDNNVTANRPLTKKAMMAALESIFESVKDMPAYRKPLADRVIQFCKNGGESEEVWRILGDEVVLRVVDDEKTDDIVDLLVEITKETDDPLPTRSRESSTSTALPSVMSLLSSLRSQSQPETDPEPTFVMMDSIPPSPRSVGAVAALVSVFSQLAFTPFALDHTNLDLAIRVYLKFIDLLQSEDTPDAARLTMLQFLTRLRADRDHRLYFAQTSHDPDGLVSGLATLIGRAAPTSNTDPAIDPRLARPKIPQERDGRNISRGRGGRPSNSGQSRSSSRVGPPRSAAVKARDPLWHVPESLPFLVAEVDTPSEVLVAYKTEGTGNDHVLPVSMYLGVIADILEKEKNWEILAYVLCYFPVQLANKHLFCGPNSRAAIPKILTILCSGILNGELAANVDRWPVGLKGRDAHGLAYHTLSVLVSYRRCFDARLQHLLVEVFQAGLNGQPSTIKCCLNALSLSAFELPSSMTKSLSRLLEKLSQIMSNPDMAVHILGFLSIVGSLRSLHANFTEADFKMVFGVALQYLQYHNRIGHSPTVSWALSQHVRILSYYIVYVWFLAVHLPDRPKHVRYITRQLLMANDGHEKVDDPTEVCFDWLARYTYASADPRPANSLLNDIVMNPTVPSDHLAEKTWLLGNSVVTIRTLSKLGWIEVLSRRPSGFTKFLCRVENAPMVGLGDVDLDMISGPASLMMERDPPKVRAPSADTETPYEETSPAASVRDIFIVDNGGAESPPARPDAITGYVWSGSAPSQRRKEVSIDPAFFALQLSAYPDSSAPSNVRTMVDPSLLPKFFGSLDRVPVIDTHKVGIMYVAPGQTTEIEILRNTHGSPAYTRFLEGIGRLINLRGQVDVYAGGLDPDEDGEYAYAWWDDIGQILYHTATMMPSRPNDPQCTNKKRHIGNDYVRIVWNDSGRPYRFDTLATQFQFVNIVIEPHSLGAIAAFSNNLHENEYFKVTVQRAPGMHDFAPVGNFKLISAENLPFLVRQLSLLADWFASVFERTQNDTMRVEIKTNWQIRLEAIQRFRNQQPVLEVPEPVEGILGQEALRDFTTAF